MDRYVHLAWMAVCQCIIVYLRLLGFDIFKKYTHAIYIGVYIIVYIVII